MTLITHLYCFHTDKLALPGENSEPSASGDIMKFENFLRILPLPQSHY